MPTTNQFDLSLFQSTAHYYGQYRPTYPAQLFKDIIQRFGLSDSWQGSGALLDLGCGTGELALPLVTYFEQIYAWDPDPDMLVETRRNARAALTPRQLRKLKTVQKSSYNLATATEKTFKAGGVGLRLVTIGQSLHWMDQALALRQLRPLIQAAPTNGLVIVSGESDAKQNALSAQKDALILATVQNYLGPKRRAGALYYSPTKTSYHDLLLETGYSNPQVSRYEYVTPHSIDQVVGYIFSLSWASKYQLGDNAVAFEVELRAGLAKLLAEAGVERFEDRVVFNCWMAN